MIIMMMMTYDSKTYSTYAINDCKFLIRLLYDYWQLIITTGQSQLSSLGPVLLLLIIIIIIVTTCYGLSWYWYYRFLSII